MGDSFMACSYCALDKVPAGEKARIKSLCDCPRLRSRLCALGITPGTVVEVCAPGSIKVREACLVLGEDMACQVLCEPLGKIA